jgi:hypothetical protein
MLLLRGHGNIFLPLAEFGTHAEPKIFFPKIGVCPTPVGFDEFLARVRREKKKGGKARRGRRDRRRVGRKGGGKEERRRGGRSNRGKEARGEGGKGGE